MNSLSDLRGCLRALQLYAWQFIRLKTRHTKLYGEYKEARYAEHDREGDVLLNNGWRRESHLLSDVGGIGWNMQVHWRMNDVWKKCQQSEKLFRSGIL
ncbi:MAG: hypothetical protein Ta2E_09150 [Mycoplasmoidaceae bacterium]|nr:MAG: hypothetical protein Ta2E_09150 [Mycoplasmoidaceae bacterium]